jgi:hypothetical protein
MTTNLKLKLIGLSTTIALFALPVADAFAGRNWY